MCDKRAFSGKITLIDIAIVRILLNLIFFGFLGFQVAGLFPCNLGPHSLLDFSILDCSSFYFPSMSYACLSFVSLSSLFSSSQWSMWGTPIFQKKKWIPLFDEIETVEHRGLNQFYKFDLYDERCFSLTFFFSLKSYISYNVQE